jgi:hypothetical protein
MILVNIDDCLRCVHLSCIELQVLFDVIFLDRPIIRIRIGVYDGMPPVRTRYIKARQVLPLSKTLQISILILFLENK